MKFTSRLIVQTKKFKCFADSISREFKHRQAKQTRENLPPSIDSRDPQRAPSHEFHLQYPARLAQEGATGQNRCRPSGSRGLAPMNLLGVRGDQIESDWPTIIGLKSAPPLRVARATEREIECKKSLSKLLSLSLWPILQATWPPKALDFMGNQSIWLQDEGRKLFLPSELFETLKSRTKVIIFRPRIRLWEGCT